MLGILLFNGLMEPAFSSPFVSDADMAGFICINLLLSVMKLA